MLDLNGYIGCILVVKTYKTRFLTITKILEETYDYGNTLSIYVNDKKPNIPYQFLEKIAELLAYKEVAYGDGDDIETYQILPNSELTKVLYLNADKE